MRFFFWLILFLQVACIRKSKEAYQTLEAQSEAIFNAEPGESAAATPEEIETYLSKVLVVSRSGRNDFNLLDDTTNQGSTNPAQTQEGPPKEVEPRQGSSVVTSAWNDLSREVPPTYTREQLDHAFWMIRETKFQTDVNGNMRRMSWLFPDDGCYTRAVLAVDLIARNLGFEAPKKIFSFGAKAQTPTQKKTHESSLTVHTTHHPSGKVSWWYHVAPVVSVDGVIYVLDPAVNPNAPMTREQWLTAQEAEGGQVGASVICDSNAYVPGSQCSGGANARERASKLQHGKFLPREWNRVIQMNRLAREVLLGDTFQP